MRKVRRRKEAEQRVPPPAPLPAAVQGDLGAVPAPHRGPSRQGTGQGPLQRRSQHRQPHALRLEVLVPAPSRRPSKAAEDAPWPPSAGRDPASLPPAMYALPGARTPGSEFPAPKGPSLTNASRSGLTWVRPGTLTSPRQPATASTPSLAKRTTSRFTPSLWCRSCSRTSGPGRHRGGFGSPRAAPGSCWPPASCPAPTGSAARRIPPPGRSGRIAAGGG